MLTSLQSQLEAELTALEARHCLRSCLPLDGCSRVNITCENKPLTSFCSNDYLGLACHPEVIRAARECAATTGFGASASRLISGTSPVHLALEEALASLAGAESTLLFPSGYQANLGVITALAAPGDLIVADRAVHASIIDACRLSRAKLALYPHLAIDHAEKHLRCLGPKARRRFIITESLFSMDGDVAPLSRLAALALAHDTALIVDEAHAIGTLGPRGAGLCAHLRVFPDVLVGTLGKALGASGAFAAGTSTLCSHLANHARSFIFTTALPHPTAAAALAAVAIITSTEGDLLRAKLHSSVGSLRSLLQLSPDPSGSPIIPILLGNDHSALEASAAIREKGLLVQPIRPPAVRPGTSRLRLTLSALHTPNQVSHLARTLRELDSLLPKPLSLPPHHPRPPQSPYFQATRSPARPSELGLVLLGTDTSVGKTTVATALLYLLASRGQRPVPFKPAETGAQPAPRDAVGLLDAAARRDIPLEVVCPYPFSAPIAPAAAAETAGLLLSPAALLAAAATARSHGEPLIVETAGGVLTPYAPRFTSADLATTLSLPVLLVARNSLGTVNHTALAVAEISRRSLTLVGILLVDTTATTTPDRACNASLISNLTGITPLGVLPYLQNPTPSALASALKASADLRPIMAVLT